MHPAPAVLAVSQLSEEASTVECSTYAHPSALRRVTSHHRLHLLPGFSINQGLVPTGEALLLVLDEASVDRILEHHQDVPLVEEHPHTLLHVVDAVAPPVQFDGHVNGGVLASRVELKGQDDDRRILTRD